jgi:PleD family two-component response regulator
VALLTISLGVATLSTIDDPAGGWETLLKEADRHLYRAKSEGRNRVSRRIADLEDTKV